MLVFLQITSLITVSLLRTALMNEHHLKNTLLHHSTTQQAQAILKSIEDAPVTQSCIIEILPTSQLWHQNDQWWESRCGGILTGIRYYYTLELLDRVACKQSNQGYSFYGQFYRISLLAIGEKQMRLRYQSVVMKRHCAYPTQVQRCEILKHGKMYDVHFGLQFRREII